MNSSAQSAYGADTAKDSGIFSGGAAIFCVLASLFVTSQFLRVSTAIVAPELMRDLDLTASELGLLGSGFFYSFAAVQIPLGWALDRFGARVMVILVPLLSVAGLFVFSAADGFLMALLGRVLCGLGMSAVLMGSFHIFASRYGSSSFGTLSGMMISVGTLGNMLAATPLAALVEAVGWRASFAMIGVAILSLCFITFRLLRKGNSLTSRNEADSDNEVIPFREGILLLVKNATFWLCSFLSFFRYGTFVALQGLWGGPYLREVMGFSPITSGNILVCFAVGAVLGATICGRLSDRVFKTRKWVLFPAIGFYTLTYLGLTGIAPLSSTWAMGILFFIMAFFGSTGVIVYAQTKEVLPKQMAGLSMTSVNLFNMAGAAIIMHLLGVVVDFYSGSSEVHSAEAYHAAFWFCFWGNLVSLGFYLFSKDSKPQ